MQQSTNCFQHPETPDQVRCDLLSICCWDLFVFVVEIFCEFVCVCVLSQTLVIYTCWLFGLSMSMTSFTSIWKQTELFCNDDLVCRSDGQKVSFEAAEKVEFEKHRSVWCLPSIYYSIPSTGNILFSILILICVYQYIKMLVFVSFLLFFIILVSWITGLILIFFLIWCWSWINLCLCLF